MSANQCLNIASASVKALEIVNQSWPEATKEDMRKVAEAIIASAPYRVNADKCIEHNAYDLIELLADAQVIPAWVG